MGCWLSCFSSGWRIQGGFANVSGTAENDWMGCGLVRVSLAPCRLSFPRASVSSWVIIVPYVVTGLLLNCVGQNKSQSSLDSESRKRLHFLKREGTKNSYYILNPPQSALWPQISHTQDPQKSHLILTSHSRSGTLLFQSGPGVNEAPRVDFPLDSETCELKYKFSIPQTSSI